MGEFVDAQVSSGRYGSVSDVMRAGLRLLEAQEAQLKTLQQALDAGERSGPPETFDSDMFIASMHAKHAS